MIFTGAGHDIGETAFCNRGVVIQDGTGTAVFVFSATRAMWKEYHDNNVSVADLAKMYPDSLKMVDAENIKDSSSAHGSLKVGDIYYNSADNSYRYVTMVDDYQTTHGEWPSSSWITLLQ